MVARLFDSILKIFIMGVLVLCYGCANPSSTTNKVFHDDYGRDIAVPESPERIVSLSPAVTEIIFALGGENLLVGRTDFCKYPEEAQQIESIGGISNLNVEKIMSLAPDLVISGSMVPKKSAEHLDKMSIPLACVIEKTTFDGLYDNIAKVGQLIGRSHAADSLISHIKSEIATLDTATQGSIPTIYYVVGFSAGGNFTAGGNTFINDILRFSGCKNIAEGIKGWNYSIEALMNADPDYILIRKEDATTFATTSPYTDLSAVRNGHILAIESGLIDLQVPRNLEAIKAIRQFISPH